MKSKQANEQAKVKIKILDVVIILLIITSFIGIYFRYSLMDMFTGNKNLKDYTVSFEISDIRYTTEEYFNIGDKVRFFEDETELGVIIEAAEDTKNALIVVPSVKTFIPENGEQPIEIPYPENTRIDASGRLLCQGSYSTDSGFLVGGKKYIAPGDRFTIKTDVVTVEIEIIKVVPTENLK